MSDELVEVVARALWEAQCDHWMHYRGQIPELCDYDQLGHSKRGEIAREARAAIAVVIERCAKVAEDETWPDRFVAASQRDGNDSPQIYNDACRDLAAAIRKLGESESS